MALNYVAIAVAALAKFFVGGLWFSSAMFMKPYVESYKKDKNYPKDKEFPDKKSGGIAAAMLFTLVASVLQTIALSCLFTGLHVATVQAAVTTTVSVVFAFTCLSSSIDGAFQKTNRTLMLINQGHHLACSVVAGVVLILLGN